MAGTIDDAATRAWPETGSTLAVITGASRGIGAGVAAAARAGGATVAACSRTKTGEANDLCADLSNPEAWPAVAIWLDQLLDAHQPARMVFVHNAATLTPIGFAGEVDPEAYRTNVLLNSAAPQVLGDAAIRAAHRTLTPTVLVQLSSGAGKKPYPGWASYCASKAAVDLWVRCVGIEQEARGGLVRTCSVAPGVVATEMQAEIRASTAEAFPMLERFHGLHAGGELDDPDRVGGRIWRGAVTATPAWRNGDVLGLDEFEA